MGPLEELLDKLTLYNGFVSHSKSILSSANVSVSNGNLYFHGSRLAYRNPLIGKIELGAISEVTKDSFEESAGDLLKQMANFYAVQAYEAFERFLKLIIVDHIWINRNSIDCTKFAIDSSSHENCILTFNKKYGNNKEKLKLLRKLSGSFKTNEENNFNSFPYREWFNILSLIRHSITHSSGRIDSGKLRYLERVEKAAATQFFHLEVSDSKEDNLIVIDCSENIKDILNRTYEYALLIYHSILVPMPR